MKSDHCIWICCHVIQNLLYIFSSCSVGSVLFAVVINGTRHVLSTPLHNIKYFLLCAQSASLALWVMLVMYQSVSFFGHMHHMNFLGIFMADSFIFVFIIELVHRLFYIMALMCIRVFWYNPISWLYCSIFYFPICCDF